MFRFPPETGEALVIDDMSVNKLSATAKTCLVTGPNAGLQNGDGVCYFFGSGEHPGVDAFALAEAGVEIDLDHVLIDFCGEGQIQSTGNMTGVAQRPIFGAVPLINWGPALRIGYRFW